MEAFYITFDVDDSYECLAWPICLKCVVFKRRLCAILTQNIVNLDDLRQKMPGKYDKLCAALENNLMEM